MRGRGFDETRRGFLRNGLATLAGVSGAAMLRPTMLRAADPTLPMDEHRALLEQTSPATAYAGGDFAEWQERARRKLVELLGVEPREDDRDFEAEHVWEREFPFGVVQKLVLRGDEAFPDMPMYWCLPHEPKGANADGKLPVMICLQGHNQTQKRTSLGLEKDERTLDDSVPGDRDMARQALERGIPALCLDQRGFAGRGDGCQHMAMRSLMLGRTLIGERVMDMSMACRWLAEQPEADMSRIGTMGNSGGGTTSIYAAGLMDQIHLAVPSCSFGPLSETWFAGSRCTCAYVPRIMQELDLPDVLALHAPDPVIVVGAENDYHSPGPAVRAGFEALKKRYAAAEAADNCHLVVGPDGHRFYAEPTWPLIEPYLL